MKQFNFVVLAITVALAVGNIARIVDDLGYTPSGETRPVRIYIP